MDALTPPDDILSPEASGPTDGRERELKLEAPLGSAPKLAAGLRAMKGVAKRGVAARLVSTYFDTADRALMKAGVSLRVRRRGRGFLQTIKFASGSVGLFDRPEWERRLRGAEPDLSPEERALLANVLGRPLDGAPVVAAIFTTNVKRTIYDVARPDLAAEIAIDEALLEAGEHRSEFCELELELLDGDPAGLFALARELLETAPLRVSVLTKSARGYAALGGHHGRPVKAGDAPIRAGHTVEEAFVAVVADCVTQYRLNEALVLEGPNPKAVHQARVALRRLRSAFSLFKGAVVDPAGERLRGELRWLAGALGDVRDLDVFTERRLDAKPSDDADDGAAEGLAAVARRTATLRQDAYAGAAEALRSRRATDLMIDLAEWAALGGWRVDPATADLRSLPIARFACEVLTKRRRKLKKAGRELRRLDPHARHQARIEAKKLRYAADFFERVYPENRRKQAAFVAHLADLQASLGDLNDIATARRIGHGIAAEAVKAGDAEVAFAAGAIAGEAAATAPKLLARAAKAYAGLVKADAFWS